MHFILKQECLQILRIRINCFKFFPRDAILEIFVCQQDDLVLKEFFEFCLRIFLFPFCLFTTILHKDSLVKSQTENV